jgi:hypothetical protein
MQDHKTHVRASSHVQAFVFIMKIRNSHFQLSATSEFQMFSTPGAVTIYIMKGYFVSFLSDQ